MDAQQNLTMLWRNLSSIKGQTHKKNRSQFVFFNNKKPKLMFKEREEIRDAIATEPKSVIAGAIIEDGDRKHGAHANPSEGRVELYLAEIVPPSMQ